MADVVEAENLAQARADTVEALEVAHAYIACAIMHIDIGDVSGAIWDLQQLFDVCRRAARAFGPVREAMRQRARDALGEAAE